MENQRTLTQTMINSLFHFDTVLSLFLVSFCCVAGYQTTPIEKANDPLEMSPDHLMFNEQQYSHFRSSPEFIANAWDKRGLIHMCAQTGCYGVTAALLKNNENVNSKNKAGNTPLHLANGNKHPEIVKLLLMYNAEIESKNDKGNTALHLATMSGCLDCVIILIRYGADINAKGLHNMAPLHISVINKDISMVVYLLKNNALRTIRDVKDKRAIDYATTDTMRDILEGLINLDDVTSF